MINTTSESVLNGLIGHLENQSLSGDYPYSAGHLKKCAAYKKSIPAKWKKDSRCYPYISLGINRFIASMNGTKSEVEGDNFLEIGAGLGIKMAVARSFCLRVHGLEINPLYVKRAIELFNYKKLPYHNFKITEYCTYNDGGIIQGDALKFKHYGLFDLIYFWSPFQGPIEVEFEKRVFKNAKVGAVIIGMSSYQKIEGNFKVVSCEGYMPLPIIKKTAA